MKGLISNVQRFSTHDGPGIRTTVFMQGCPLACRWCHNPETISFRKQVIYEKIECSECLTCVAVCQEGCFQFSSELSFDSRLCTECGHCVEACETGALKWSSREYTVSELTQLILKDELFFRQSFGGVTFSGGEPMGQSGFCYEVFRELKSHGLHIAVDTSGYTTQEQLKKIINHVDLFLYDIKIFDIDLHTLHTGKSNETILNNLQFLSNSGKKIIVRIPLVPKYTDYPENIVKIKNHVKGISDSIDIEDIPYNKLCLAKQEMAGKVTIK